jgi:hypothetical protein
VPPVDDVHAARGVDEGRAADEDVALDRARRLAPGRIALHRLGQAQVAG